MSYRRRSSWESNPPTKVTLNWQQTSQVYALKLHKPPGSNYFPKEHWNQFNTIIKPILMSIPSGSEREYDPMEETWYFSEKYFESIRNCFQVLSNFSLDVMEKPLPNSGMKNTVLDLALMKSQFHAITDVYPDDVDFKTAKKAFFRASMRLHPDKNDGKQSNDFYLLNEAWQELEYQFYKTKQRITELKDMEEVTYG